MACQIFRAETGEIQAVTNEQGNPSTLYAAAYALTGNEEKALDIWSVAQTQDYKTINGENQTEPSLQNVLKYINRYNSQNKKLSPADIDELTNNSLSLPLNYIEEIYSATEEMFPNGVFTLSEATLNRSGLYSPAEIQAVLNTPSAQQKIKQTVDKIRAEVSVNDNIETPTLAIYETPELISVQDTTELIGVGKFMQLNPFLIDKELKQKVGGIKNREDFETALDTANEAITEKYYSNTEYADKLFETYSSMERMPLLEDGEEGLTNTLQNNIKAFTQQALVIGQDSKQIRNIIDLLQSTPKLVWTNSGIEIEDMLLRLEDYATDLGIDIIGISEQEFSYEEGQVFLSTLYDLVSLAESGNVNDSIIEQFADQYNTVFQSNISPVVTAKEMNAANKGRNLVVVDSVKSEQELFDQNSLLKVNEESVYQRVNKQEDIEGLYDYVTNLIQFNPTVVERTALYPSAYDSTDRFSIKKAQEASREDIKADLRRYVQQQPHSEELTLYKIAFGHPVVFPTQEKEIRNQMVSVNYEYLTGDFISDFARVYLQEKLKGSKMFEKVYSHFGFNTKGIILKDTDPYSKQEINTLTPQRATIRQYAAISKDAQLNSLFPVINQAQEMSPRVFYLNNPEQLKQKTLQYELSEDGQYLATQNMQDDFINVNGRIWEKVNTAKNITVYEQLPDIVNPYYNIPNIELTLNRNVDMKQFSELSQSLENLAKIEKLYTNKELEKINSETEC